MLWFVTKVWERVIATVGHLLLWELDIATGVVADVTTFFSLATNFPCFSLNDILLLATKSENLGASSPEGSFLKVEPWLWNWHTWARVLSPLNIKGQPTHDRSHEALIAQLGKHCTRIAKDVCWNPVQVLKCFKLFFPVVLWLHLHLSSCLHLFAAVAHLLCT